MNIISDDLNTSSSVCADGSFLLNLFCVSSKCIGVGNMEDKVRVQYRSRASSNTLAIHLQVARECLRA